jgi:MarR family transcriptional regulator, organic hydroperoxide resistance regulator
LAHHASRLVAVTISETAEDLLALERQVCFALSVAARNVVAVYRPVLEPLGLTHPQYLVMLALWQHGTLSVKDLSGLLQLDPGTLSPLLKRLESAGLVRRDRQRGDERSVLVTLTTAGQALEATARDIPHRAACAASLPLDQLHALRTQLDAFTATIEGEPR